jgi:hypothetical protein
MITIGVVGWLPVRDIVRGVLGGNVPVPVTHAKDTSSGMTGHIYGDTIEVPAPMDHYGGAAQGRHSFASTVLHKSQPLVQSGHDQGALLPHAPVAFPYVLSKSNRKNAFASAAVQFQGKPAACIHGYFWRMMACGDPVSLPMTIVVSNSTHTVFVGMNDVDVVAGVMGIGASVAVDLLTAPSSMTELGDGMANDAGGVDPKKMAYQLAMNFAASMVVSDYSGWEEPIGTKVEVSNPLAQKSLEITYDPKTGAWERKFSENEFSEKRTITVKSEPNGELTTQTEQTGGHVSRAADELGEWL